ncbi:polysaccharide deacetylase [Sphingomonas lenta]|uniref:Polysaccharide deacetylase n=1 Tax=Sphingomonas lenta TaxID=1141887 RepID=A0A2A2SJF3_9SPHN|nr:polysaccharide deacetylase [Sphingomonas lenta]PAX09414.1 polysaccharide deacetylase [Sphingomonas lenta]
MTTVFLTVDTEFAWRHHVDGLPVPEIHRRSIEPADVGVAYQLARMAEHRLKGCFFVDPMPAVTYGVDAVRRFVAPILEAGQEVQLHLHPNWAAARPGDRGEVEVRFELCDYLEAEQRALIARATELLVAAGAPEPVAFRAGSYAADDRTLAALAALGFAYDSSHNGAFHPWPCKTSFDRRRIAPVEQGVVEVPVTVIEDASGSLRTAQICALSTGEMRAMLEHAVAEEHAAVTIVSHSFELAARGGLKANRVHVRRFDALCAMLAERRDVLPTAHFRDRPALPLDRDDKPLGPSALRRRWRQAEQLWSNLVEERA